VAGVIDDRDIGIAGAVGKIAQRAPGVAAERSRRESTTSKPASFRVEAILALSLTGLASGATLW